MVFLGDEVGGPARRIQGVSILSSARRHPLAAYYFLAFAVSWGGILAAAGPGGILGTSTVSGVDPLLYVAALSGPTVAGIVLSAIVRGRQGIHDIRTRLFKWRAGWRFYGIALLTAPLLMGAALCASSLTPTIVTADDKVGLLLIGTAMGLTVGFFEELGWTGFAVPELRKRRGLLGTGLIAGLLWGLWHLPLFSGTSVSSGGIPPLVYLAVLLFSFLPPYRILMVWLHDHTKSLPVVILAHAPLAGCQLVLTAGVFPDAMAVVKFDLLFAGLLWLLAIAIVASATSSRSSILTPPRVGRDARNHRLTCSERVSAVVFGSGRRRGDGPS